jgi:Papain family cysteine protease
MDPRLCGLMYVMVFDEHGVLMKNSVRKSYPSQISTKLLSVFGKDATLRNLKVKSVRTVSGFVPNSAKVAFISQLAGIPVNQLGCGLSRLSLNPARNTPAHVRGYGWSPSLRHIDSIPFDHESFGVMKPKRLPNMVDLRACCPPVYDQLKLNSCTANAISAALEFDLKRQGARPFMPSRLYIYWNERAQLGTIGQDTGASIYLSTEVVRELGACHEADWPYVAAKFAELPCPGAFESADSLRLKAAYHLDNRDLNALKGVLASGVPFVFGISVYQSFESPIVMHIGLVPLPVRGEVHVGGHAMMAVGYDDKNRMFLVRNSWSPKWGIDGYCWIPYKPSLPSSPKPAPIIRGAQECLLLATFAWHILAFLVS